MRRAKEDQLGGKTELYSTPRWATRRLLDTIDLPAGGRWFEAGIGVGAIVRAVHEHSDRYRGIRWSGVEIDPIIATHGVNRMVMAGIEVCVDVADFLEWYPPVPAFDVAIFNPPNSLAEPFLRKALAMARLVAMFQPLQFYAGSDSRRKNRDRAGLFAAHPPEHVLVLPDRPKFAGDSSPMQTYAWYVFSRRTQSYTALSRLAQTPVEERTADFERQAAEDAADFGAPPVSPSVVVSASEVGEAAAPAGAEAECG